MWSNRVHEHISYLKGRWLCGKNMGSGARPTWIRISVLLLICWVTLDRLLNLSQLQFSYLLNGVKTPVPEGDCEDSMRKMMWTCLVYSLATRYCKKNMCFEARRRSWNPGCPTAPLWEFAWVTQVFWVLLSPFVKCQRTLNLRIYCKD